MASAGTVFVEVQAKTQKFRQGLKSAGNRLSRFASGAKRALFSFKGLVVAAFSIAAIVKFKNMIIETAESIDRLQKLSLRFDIPIEKIQELEFVAKLAGVTISDMERALGAMGRRVAEAAEGTGEAVSALKDLGLNAQNLTSLKLDKQFFSIARAFRGVSDAGKGISLVRKLFGRSGEPLIQVFKQDIDSIKKRFEDLNVGISQGQGELVAKFNDTRAALSTIWEGIKQQITIALSEPFEIGLKKLEEYIKAQGGARQVGLNLANTLVNGFNKVVEIFNRLLRVTLQIQLAFENIRSTIFQFLSMVNKVEGALVSVRSKLDPLIGKVDPQSDLGKRLSGKQSSLQVNQQVLGGIQSEIQARRSNLSSQIRQTRVSSDSLIPNIPQSFLNALKDSNNKKVEIIMTVVNGVPTFTAKPPTDDDVKVTIQNTTQEAARQVVR